MSVDRLGLWVFEKSLGLYLVVEGAGSKRVVRVHSIQHLEENDAERPDISFQAIRFAAHYFRGHGCDRPQGSAFDLGVLLRDLQLLRKPEVNDLIGAIMRHNVFCLQVPVDDVVAMQFHHADNDVFGDHHCFRLRDPAFLVDFGLQGLSVAVLDCHDFEVIVAVDVEALDEVWAVALVH